MFSYPLAESGSNTHRARATVPGAEKPQQKGRTSFLHRESKQFSSVMDRLPPFLGHVEATNVLGIILPRGLWKYST